MNRVSAFNNHHLNAITPPSNTHTQKKKKNSGCTWNNNKHENTLHEIIIYKSCVSLKVQRSHNDEYVLFKSVELDDPPIKEIGEVLGNFIM
jgi:hypothetical protein